MKVLVLAIIVMAIPLSSLAQTPSDPTEEIQSLRKEIAALRAAQEARLAALEQRLEAAEASSKLAVAPAPIAPAAGANAFNPSMSLILSGGYVNTSVDPASYRLAGFQLPANTEAGPGARGFNLGESELGLAASIDPWLRGAANIALHADDSVSVEEAYFQTTALGHGVSIKAGRFFSGIGYLNPQHAHTWDFADNPLVYQALLGTQYGDDGVQLSLLAPTDLYIEVGAELGRGRSFPGSDTGRNGAGMTALTFHAGGDVGDSSSWRAGISTLSAKASEQPLVAADAANSLVDSLFTGSTRVWIADGIWKWSPHGNATRSYFKLQAEYLRSTRSGDLIYDLNNGALPASYRATQSGWYVQGVYQFIRHWRVGLRTERLDAGQTSFGGNVPLLTFTGDQPYKHTAMLDFSPSEFSRLRMQFARDYSRGNVADNQTVLQYQMSLGAHGAHSY